MSLPPTNYLIHVSTIKCKCAGNYTRHMDTFFMQNTEKTLSSKKCVHLKGIKKHFSLKVFTHHNLYLILSFLNKC